MLWNYLGSKQNFLGLYQQLLKKHCQDIATACDLFSGTGYVSSWLASQKYQVYSNDAEFYSYVINFALLICDYGEAIECAINELNSLEGVEGFLYKNYTFEGTMDQEFPRMYYTKENAMMIDAMRMKIEEWHEDEIISVNEYYYLLASLIIASDKVANVAGTYGSFLKEFKTYALNQIKVEPIHKRTNKNDHRVTNLDAVTFMKMFKGRTFDLIYMDPPYTKRQYNTNYHLLNIIAIYNPDLQVYGTAGLPIEENRFISSFCSTKNVDQEFLELTELIKQVSPKYLIFTYSSNGIMELEFIQKTFESLGSLILYRIPYKNFNIKDEESQKGVMEYIFFVKVGKKAITEVVNIIDCIT